MHPAALTDADLLKQCDLTKGRSSGPGGQHRNKVETKVTLHHTPTGVEAHAGERRSVEDNKRVALFRLRLNLALAVRLAVPLGDARSDLWKSRVSAAGRISCNPGHRDFPALLAEALDMIESCGLDTNKAAIRLECSHSQLIKLMKDHPAALTQVNQQREARGLHGLK
jgi:hypothetical protein